MRVPCVGAVVLDGDGRLLVIRRGRPPSQGLWSLPGGRVEADETDSAAVVREMLEETGLTVSVGRLIGTVDRPGPGDDVTYEIRDYAATVSGGRLLAGDDASDARWVTPAELRSMATTPGLLEALSGWRILTGSTRFSG